MKKAYKILTLIVSLMLIATVFTVVALAEGEAPVPVTTGGYDFEYEDKNAGDTHNDSASKLGKWTYGVADNGNKYVIAEYATATGTNGDNWDVSIPDSAKYTIGEYPIFALDFDIMSDTGAYHWSATIRTDLYGAENNSWRVTQLGSVKLNADGMKLPSEKNVWNHVTYIVEYVGDGVFSIHSYVNGVKSMEPKTTDYKVKDFTKGSSDKNPSKNWNDLLDENGELKYDNIRASVLSIYPPYRDDSATEKISYDNFNFTYFPKGYTPEQVANYIYNDNYKMPYGQTEAKVNDTYYDDINEAISALLDGDKLTLKTDVEDTVIINKAVTIDTNKYDAEGNPTGEYYKANVKSNGGYLVDYNEGVYTLTKSDKSANVVFDPACTDETCTCYGIGIGHRQTYSAIVPVGAVPEFLPEIAIINNDGTVADFLGWSYENDGTVDILTEVTEAQADGGTLNIYPVYKITKYDFSITDANGSETYYMAKEFEAKLAESVSIAGTKITLYSDTECYLSVKLYSNMNFTLDLNGHTLTRAYLTGTKYKFDTAAGDYAELAATNSIAFLYGDGDKSGGAEAHKCTFNMISSKPGAVFRTFAGEGTVWYDADGNFVEREITAVTGGATTIYAYYTSKSFYNFENIDIFSLNIINNSHNGSSPTVNITGCNFYRTTGGSQNKGGYGNDFMYVAGAATVNVKDSLLYFPSSSVLSGDVRLIRVQGSSTAKVVYDNVDLITDNSAVQIRLEHTNHSFTFKNCRVYNTKNEQSAYKPTFENNVYATNTIANASLIAEGYTILNQTNTFTYSLPTAHRVMLDTETGNPTFNFAFADKEISFTHETKLYTEVYVPVTWLDESGNVISTADELRNTTVTAPVYAVATGDGWTGALVTKWNDADGNAADLYVTDAVAYTFKVDPTPDAEPTYIGKIIGAKFNYIYYNQFKTILYLPVTEGMAAPAVTEFSAESYPAYIDGVAYWMYLKDNTTAGISDELTVTVTFTKGGAEYTDDLTTSALIYAEEILNAPASDAERVAVANMVRFVKEARNMLSLEVSEKFDELIALGNIADLGAKEDYTDASVNYAALAPYVKSISFMVDRTYAGYLITLTDTAAQAGAVVTVKYVDGGEAVTVIDSKTVPNTKLTNKAKIYDIGSAIEITVTIPGDEPVVAVGTYSAKAYINSTDSVFAKAMYEFGVAVAAYRETF